MTDRSQGHAEAFQQVLRRPPALRVGGAPALHPTLNVLPRRRAHVRPTLNVIHRAGGDPGHLAASARSPHHDAAGNPRRRDVGARLRGHDGGWVCLPFFSGRSAPHPTGRVARHTGACVQHDGPGRSCRRRANKQFPPALNVFHAPCLLTLRFRGCHRRAKQHSAATGGAAHSSAPAIRLLHAPFLPDTRSPRMSASINRGSGRPTPGSDVVASMWHGRPAPHPFPPAGSGE